MNGNQRLAMRRLGRRTMTWKAAWFVLAAWLASAAGMLCPVAGAQAVSGTVNVGSFPYAMQLNPVTNKVYVADFTSNTSPNNVIVIDGATNSTTTITTGVGTVAVGVNPVTNKIYAANFNSNDVTVIDGATNSTTTVAVGSGPGGIAMNPVTNKIYVANFNSNDVTVIDGATNTTTTVAAGSEPSAVAVNPLTNKVYVTNNLSANVTVIDGATNSATTVSTGNDPVAVAVNPVTNKIYVANNLSASVTVIDGATNSTTTVSTGGNPDAVAINPLTNKIYVANNQTANVTVIDGATNSTITVATGEIPEAVAVNPLTNKIYVGCGNNSNIVVIDGATNTTTTIAGTQNQVRLLLNPVTNKVYGNNFAFVTVIDGAAITTTLVTIGTNPQSIAANLETNKIYVPNRDSNDVTVIDGATNATATVAAGAQPVAVAVNPVTNSIYIANNGDNTVTVIDGTTNTSTTVASGAAPVAVAVNPVTNKIYVANHNDNTVTVIDGITNSTTTVATGGQPAAVAVNPVTNKIYVASLGNSVTVIDGATNFTTTIPDGDGPAAIAVNPATNKIYVADSSINAFGNNTVTVIDGATNSTTTIPTGFDPPLAVDVNPITNKIYFANTFDTVTILDGATNTPTTITVGQQPVGMVVNPVTNKIYVANSGDITITVIDGPTNTIIATIPSGLGPSGGMAVNPVTDTVYTTTAGGTEGKVLVLQEQQAPPIPLQAAITPLPGNITGIFTPTLHFSDSGAFPPLAPPVQAMYMQIDTWQGPWTLATSEGNEQFTATLATPLQPGIHIAYAYADLQDITSANQGTSSTPFVSNITGYAFVVAPPSAGLSPTSLDFGQQPVNTTSPAQTETLTNANSPLDIGGSSVSGHFLESDNCPAQLAAGASCTISVMFAPVFGDQENTVTGAVTITDDNNGIIGNTDTIALTGVAVGPPLINKAFGAASIPLNGITSLTFTISNPNNNVALTGIAFSDTFPAGLIVSASPALNNSCGGTVTAAAGSSSISLSGAGIGANAICVVSVNVTGVAAGTKNDTSSAITSANGGTGATAFASLIVVAPPVIAESFTPNVIAPNTNATLTYTITSPSANTTTLTGVTFTDTLPANIVVASGGVTGTCGSGTITATAGSNNISLTGGTIPAAGSCTFSVNLTGSVVGNYSNSTGVVGSSNGGSGNNVSSNLSVQVADLTVASTHAGFFPHNSTDTYTLTVTNIGLGPTHGTVSVTDTLPNVPNPMTVADISGSGWNCNLATLTCTCNDVLPAAASYPPITVTVNVPANIQANVINTVTVAGGGETNTSNDTASDPTYIGAAVMITLQETGITVYDGQEGSVAFRLDTIPNPGPITFSCSGLPLGTSCGFSPGVVNQSTAQVTLTISSLGRVKQNSSLWNQKHTSRSFYTRLILPSFGLGMGMVFLGRRRPSKKAKLLFLASSLGLMILFSLAGCGGSATPYGTPGGTYPTTVTASGAPGQATARVTLTVLR